MTLAAGTVIAQHYRVVRLLGRGGMGEVYEVQDLRVDRARALKIMHAHAADDPTLRERFELEARLGGRVDSPHLVEVFDAGVDEASDRLFLVMELLRGETLAQRIQRLGPRPASEVVDHAAQLAATLDRMHARGVVHRDLKPANVFLAGDAIKLLDLGIAKVLTGGNASTTHVAGTPAYMAPEQLRGRGITPSTDRYAFALVGYTLLVGRAYWDDEASLDPVAFGLRAVQGPPEPATVRARRAAVSLDERFDAWFARATAADPDRRFGSAAAQVRALATALAIEPPASLGAHEPDPEPAAIIDHHDRGQTELATPVPARRRRVPVVLVALAGVTTVVLLARSCGGSAAPTVEVVACPVFEVADPARDGWLGAAAATITCERLRFVFGGAEERALPPAELLGLPRGPVDRFPADPYDGDARARSLTAAAGLAILDGAVRRSSDGFDVEVVLRDRDGTAIATGRGRDRALYAAVRTAMTPLVDGGALTAVALQPAVAEYTRAASTQAALGYLDLTMAFANNAGSLPAECARGSMPEELASWFRYDCAYTLGRATGDVDLPAATGPGAVAARVRIEHMRYQRGDEHDLERLAHAYRDEPSGFGRSMLAVTLSRGYQVSRPEAALDWAHRAVQADPRNAGGERCAPWVQLATLGLDTGRAAAVTAGWRGWAPWDSYAWSLAADHATDDDTALRYARRAYELSPLDTYVAGRLADRLLRRGLREETRAIAVALGTSDAPVHALQRELIAVRIDASAARFAAALAHAESGLQLAASDHGWVRQQRLELAWRAVQIARIVGRGHEVADRAFAEFLEPTALPIDGGHIDAPLWLAAICAYTSRGVAPRCFARLAEVMPRLAGGVVTSTAPFVTGARSYALGDLAGAARAWRPLVADAGAHVQILAEAMVEAFAGEREVVERITSSTAGQAIELGGASLVTARAAIAARQRGDHGRADELVAITRGAWSAADTEIPILRELR